MQEERERDRGKGQNVSLTSFGVFGNETPLNTSEPPRDLCPSCHKIRDKAPGNLGSYSFLKIHGYPVCLCFQIRFTKILSKRKLNFIVKSKLYLVILGVRKPTIS
jgi:hypothetical protein